MYSTVKDQIIKRLFGEGGGATHGDVVSLARRDRLSQYLPYQYYDDIRESYSSIDDTIGYVWECTPLYFVTKDVVKRLQKLIQLPFPSDVTISFHLYADPHIKDFIDAYQTNKTRDDVVLKKAAEEYGNFLLNGSNGIKNIGDVPARNFRLIISIKCHNGLDDDLLSNVEDALIAAKLNPVRLAGDRLKQFLVRFINGMENQDVARHLDSQIPIRKQLIRSDTRIHFPEKGFSSIGDKYGACLTFFRVPDTTNPLNENKLLGGFMGFEDDTRVEGMPNRALKFVTIIRLVSKMEILKWRRKFGHFSKTRVSNRYNMV